MERDWYLKKKRLVFVNFEGLFQKQKSLIWIAHPAKNHQSPHEVRNARGMSYIEDLKPLKLQQ